MPKQNAGGSHYLPTLVFLHYLPTEELGLGSWYPYYDPGVTTKVAICPKIEGSPVPGAEHRWVDNNGVRYDKHSISPLIPKPEEWEGKSNTHNSHITTYAMTAWLGWDASREVGAFDDPPYVARRISSAPAERFLLTDGQNLGLIWDDGWWNSRTRARHDFGMNLLFLGGHVDYRKDSGNSTVSSVPEWHDAQTQDGTNGGYWQKYYW